MKESLWPDIFSHLSVDTVKRIRLTSRGFSKWGLLTLLKQCYLKIDDLRVLLSLPYFKYIERIKFGDNFNDSPCHTPGLLPRNLTHLMFGKTFNRPIVYLPPRLTHLAFSHNFDGFFQSGVLPWTLTHLTLGDSYSRPLTFIPQSVTHLIVGANFKESFRFKTRLYHLKELTVHPKYNYKKKLLKAGFKRIDKENIWKRC